MIFNNKQRGFTLAEVMITMMIVGVVAAMTIPTLHYSRIKKEYSARLKNFYSKMNNAILDMEMEKGSFRDMYLPDQGGGYDWYMENVDPYMGHEFTSGDKPYPNQVVYFKDGSALRQFYSGGCDEDGLNCGGCLDVNYDVNGDKGKCQMGVDCYRFLYCFTDNNRKVWFANKDIFFGVYGHGLTGANITREQMIEKCATPATEENPSTGPSWCTRLLQNDQWEYKSDYPYKF